ncbi:MAG: succinate dehydrogenase cytochrome b subunit [Bacteroidia bacterium]|jgi:succinate dehydrogenase / fumarate reductase cytochrome b subunit|nr:succinate dehydrogenase cytochrome b subunit [Bacteroidia bacterium]
MAKGMFSYSIGKKLIMGLTGMFLILFLIVHCGINSLIFLNDGGETFNRAAEFMSHNWLMRTLEVGLFLGFILHIIQSLILTLENKKARKIGYAVSNANANSKWYSRSMGLLGTLILIFLILHLRHFWVVSRFTDHISSGEETLYDEMKEVFANPIVVIIYVLAQISLAYHLMHGFQSAFQTLGLNHKKYTPIIKKIGTIYAIIIPLLFALMPIVMYLGIVK